jgi:hypothetical protein
VTRVGLPLFGGLTGSRSVHWILRWSVSACFVGHGMFGVAQKREWLAFFVPFGVPERVALTLMPFLGVVDITLGCLALVRPTRALFLYTAGWGLLTVLLRPLVGLSFFETLERAGNYGPSLALLLGSASAHLLARTPIYDVSDPVHYRRMKQVLSATTFLLLLGHGALAAAGKPLLVEHWRMLGVVDSYGDGRRLVQILGVIEISLAGIVLLRPSHLLCVSIAGWKVLSESLFLVADSPVWEVVERGGSYGAPLALAVLLSLGVPRPRSPRSSGLGAANAPVERRSLALRSPPG